MSAEAAISFLQRVEDDEDLAAELARIGGDVPAVVARVRAQGFDVTAEEVREAFVERYGAELTAEQLEQLAAGVDWGVAIGAGVGGAWLLVGVTAAAAAA